MAEAYRKPAWVECEDLEDSSVLLNTKTLQSQLLNDVAAALWEALDEYPTAEGLAELMAEARPETPQTEHLDAVRSFLSGLCEAGFLVREAPTEVGG